MSMYPKNMFFLDLFPFWVPVAAAAALWGTLRKKTS